MEKLTLKELNALGYKDLKNDCYRKKLRELNTILSSNESNLFEVELWLQFAKIGVAIGEEYKKRFENN